MKKVLAQNKKALFDYEVLDEFETGIKLEGREVKPLKAGNVNIKGAFVVIQEEELFLKGATISRYKYDGSGDYDPKRLRKLLLKKKEIERIMTKLNTQGVTLIPIEFYLKKNLIKLRIALGKGRKKHDKRQLIKKRDQKREIEKAIKSHR